jgi:uncharacterized protein
MIAQSAMPPEGPAAEVPREPPRPMTPVSEPERLAGLDVLRGLAIFGILMVNMALFAMPLTSAFDHTALADAPPAERVCWAIVRGLFEYKFVSLFSLLFGAGLAVQMGRAEARGVAFAPLYTRRLLLLMGLGLIHGYLLWYGDILFMYACVGFLALLLRNVPARTMLWLAGVGLGVTIFITGAGGVVGVVLLERGGPAAAGATGAEAAAPAAGERGPDSSPAAAAAESDGAAVPGAPASEAPPPPARPALADDGKRNGAAAEPAPDAAPPARAADSSPPTQWRRYADAWRQAVGGGSGPDLGAAETIAFKEGPFLIALVHRAILFTAILLTTGVIGGFMLRVLAFFLVGIVLMRAGFFQPQRRRWHRLACAAGLLIGLPGEALLVLAYVESGYEMSWLTMAAETLHLVSSAALCLGYAGAVMLLSGSRLGGLLARTLGAVGRMALSNYILQTLVATAIMYWWGFARFGEVDRPTQMVLVGLICAAQLVLSPLWLRFFTMGPLEWLWRALTYRSRPALRRRGGGPGTPARRESSFG